MFFHVSIAPQNTKTYPGVTHPSAFFFPSHVQQNVNTYFFGAALALNDGNKAIKKPRNFVCARNTRKNNKVGYYCAGFSKLLILPWNPFGKQKLIKYSRKVNTEFMGEMV